MQYLSKQMIKIIIRTKIEKELKFLTRQKKLLSKKYLIFELKKIRILNIFLIIKNQKVTFFKNLFL